MGVLGFLVSTRFAADLAGVVLVKGTLVLLSLGLAARALRAYPARVRHRVWAGGLIALLALPVVALGFPSWGPGAGHYPAETMLLGLEALETAAPAATPSAAPASTAPGPPSSLAPLPLPSALLLAWWIGAVAVAVRLAFDLVSARLLRLRSREVEREHPAWRLLEDERQRLGIRRPVALLEAPHAGLAATLGVLRPCVVVGPDVLGMSLERLRALFVHELAHVRRGDHATHLLSTLGMPLYWPNPLFWWARRRTALEREQACDQEVLDGGVAAPHYARILLDFATSDAAGPPPSRGTHGLLSFSPTRARIHSVLDDTSGRRRLGVAAGAGLAAVLLTIAVPTSSMRLLAFEPGTGPTGELTAALGHADPEVRARAARTLGRRDPGRVRLDLERLLDDPDAGVRLAAIGALEQLGDPASLPAMARVLRRPYDGGAGEHGYVLKLAMKTLARIGSPEAVGVLEAQLGRPVEQLRWLALESMLATPAGTVRAVPHLERFAASDRSARNRRLAAEALARVAEVAPST